MVPPRHFTPEEAQARIAQVRPLLVELRDAFHSWRFAREQLDELVAFGEGDTDEAARFARDVADHGARVDKLLADIRELGADVKDPLLGLIDFPALREGKTVLLCYRDDEAALAWWHPIDTGFAGRRPLTEF